jgi:ribosomal protein S18 acetylase RimI-like enzyme
MLLVRRATLEDSEAICNLHVASIERLCSTHYSASQIVSWAGFMKPELYAPVILDPDRCFVVAEEARVVVGFGQLNRSAAEIEAIYVHPAHARMGIGRSLMRFLEQEAQKAGLRALRLTATLNAVEFYQRCGYTTAGVATIRHPCGATLGCEYMTKELKRTA